ncbi:protein EFR3 [Kwoniella heveanensis BCC8398]|uniref:Protein EFR3 n=1 Tax=Kwoniella heveanensis BCC8398 TaxID=1296120 RepID=A0A1B9H3G6_9TREE|nr:protein EFR3 [Kwoniella heveanensis BCC8398]
MGCIPCTNLQPEVAHLNACYPPSKALLTAGPDYRPLSQDLSKLTYFATNKPSKLAKIGEELEKRVNKEAARSTGGYPKYRASLLISLAILRALLTECKRDIPLFGRSALKIISTCLDVKVYQRGGMDLEVIGRAAAAFIAFTTYTDGASIGVDEGMTRAYLEILRKFGNMAIFKETTQAQAPGGALSEKGNEAQEDVEYQNRTRLIALAAINGASTSDAVFASTTEFPKQVTFILPPLLHNMFDNTTPSSMSDMKFETAKIDMDASPSPFFSEFSARRPINDRRAPSLHAHIPGEKGPTTKDVLSASLRSFHALIGQCKVAQATIIIDQIGSFLDRYGYWADVERCCWLAERLTAWITLQYRFVVPTRLVEVLVDDHQDKIAGHPTTKHTSALAMITTILNSTTSLIGLGISDLLGNLVSLIIRRIRHDERDPLLPPLVQCVSSLGTHIYYADQINDIIEELSTRIAELSLTDKSRPEIIRVLVQCMIGVMVVADHADEEARSKVTANGNGNGTASIAESSRISIDKGKGPAIDTPLDIPRPKNNRRNPIAPEVWQETLPLLCEADYAVRSTYARALLLFLETEMPRGSVPGRPGSYNRSGSSADATTYRFCNALHAAIYTLAMSNCLTAGVPDEVSGRDSTAAPSPDVSKGADNIAAEQPGSATTGGSGSGDAKSGRSGLVNGDPNGNQNGEDSRHGSISGKGEKSEKGVSFNLTSPTPSSTPPTNGTSTPPRKNSRPARRPSLPLNRLQSYVNLSSFDNVATPLDFAAALKILDELYTLVPTTALMTGVPMLLALDKDAGNDLVRRPGDGRQGAWVLERKRAIRELVCLVWRRIGERWDAREVDNLANKTLLSLPEPYVIPLLPPYTPSPALQLPEAATSFVPHTIEGESSAMSKPLLDPEILVSSLANSESVQSATGRDAGVLVKRWTSRWTVENAIKDSVERLSSAHVKPADHSPTNEIANVLMSMNNGSLQSFGGRPGSAARGIDVEDLREALGGRTDDISPISGAPSMISSVTPEDHRKLSLALQKGLNANGGVSGAGGGGGRGHGGEVDVKEVLKDIFRDKKRSSGGGHARTSSTGGRDRDRNVSSKSTTVNGTSGSQPFNDHGNGQGSAVDGHSNSAPVSVAVAAVSPGTGAPALGPISA